MIHHETRSAYCGPRIPAALLFALIFTLATPAQAAVIVQIGRNITGATYGNDTLAEPADCNGAVGPSHFVQLVNGRFAVFAKSNGARVKSLTDDAFWRSTGISLPSNLTATDPRVVFDTYSQRWIALGIDVDFANQVSNRFLLAISAGTDPTGTWRGVGFAADPVSGNFADFPTLGVDADGVYIGANMFGGPGTLAGMTMLSIPKQGLLASPLTIAGRKSFGILAPSQYGYVLQPAVASGTTTGGASILAVGSLGTDFKPHTTLVATTIRNAATPNGATLSAPKVLTVPAYNVPINPPQPDGSDNLDDGDARFTSSVCRVGDLLYAVHAVQVNNRAALRWYCLNAFNSTLSQSGTISDTNLHLFFPSIAANDAGTVVIGFNGCSTNALVSSYAVAGDTVDGVLKFGNLMRLKAGAASYQSPSGPDNISRWGDYSATSVDPADPSRFWTVQLFPSRTNVWATQITELITTPLRLAVALEGANVVLSWPSAATGFQLQTRASLQSTEAWSSVTQTPVLSGGRLTVQLPVAGKEGHFRLAKP